MAVCSIDKERGEKLFKAVVALLNDQVQANEILDIKSIAQKIYDKILSVSNDRAKALSYAMLVPSIANKAFVLNQDFQDYIVDNDIDTKEIAKLARKLNTAPSNTVLNVIAEFLGQEPFSSEIVHSSEVVNLDKAKTKWEEYLDNSVKRIQQQQGGISLLEYARVLVPKYSGNYLRTLKKLEVVLPILFERVQSFKALDSLIDRDSSHYYSCFTNSNEEIQILRERFNDKGDLHSLVKIHDWLVSNNKPINMSGWIQKFAISNGEFVQWDEILAGSEFEFGSELKPLRSSKLYNSEGEFIKQTTVVSPQWGAKRELFSEISNNGIKIWTHSIDKKYKTIMNISCDQQKYTEWVSAMKSYTGNHEPLLLGEHFELRTHSIDGTDSVDLSGFNNDLSMTQANQILGGIKRDLWINDYSKIRESENYISMRYLRKGFTTYSAATDNSIHALIFLEPDNADGYWNNEIQCKELIWTAICAGDWIYIGQSKRRNKWPASSSMVIPHGVGMFIYQDSLISGVFSEGMWVGAFEKMEYLNYLSQDFDNLNHALLNKFIHSPVLWIDLGWEGLLYSQTDRLIRKLCESKTWGNQTASSLDCTLDRYLPDDFMTDQFSGWSAMNSVQFTQMILDDLTTVILEQFEPPSTEGMNEFYRQIIESSLSYVEEHYDEDWTEGVFIDARSFLNVVFENLVLRKGETASWGHLAHIVKHIAFGFDEERKQRPIKENLQECYIDMKNYDWIFSGDSWVGIITKCQVLLKRKSHAQFNGLSIGDDKIDKSRISPHQVALNLIHFLPKVIHERFSSKTGVPKGIINEFKVLSSNWSKASEIDVFRNILQFLLQSASSPDEIWKYEHLESYYTYDPHQYNKIVHFEDISPADTFKFNLEVIDSLKAQFTHLDYDQVIPMLFGQHHYKTIIHANGEIETLSSEDVVAFKDKLMQMKRLKLEHPELDKDALIQLIHKPSDDCSIFKIRDIAVGVKDSASTLYTIFFDTETTGLPKDWEAPVSDLDNWPRLVQIAWVLCDKSGNRIDEQVHIIKPEGFEIPKEASDVHGITTDIALIEGKSLLFVMKEFSSSLKKACKAVAHNMAFDEKIVGAEFLRNCLENPLNDMNRLCTMKATTKFVGIKNYYGYKWPTLSELHIKLFGADFEGAHDAYADISATVSCYWELKKIGLL